MCINARMFWQSGRARKFNEKKLRFDSQAACDHYFADVATKAVADKVTVHLFQMGTHINQLDVGKTDEGWVAYLTTEAGTRRI